MLSGTWCIAAMRSPTTAAGFLIGKPVDESISEPITVVLNSAR